jgi:hypothetical protein
MSAYALVEDGVVTEVVETPPGTPMLRHRYHPDVLAKFVPVPVAFRPQVQPGWTWDGNAFAPPLPPSVLPPAVPHEVTNFQARAVLMSLPGPGGVGTMFEAADAALRAQGGTAWQAWEYANNLTRDGELVTTMAAGLGLSPEQVDALFIAASAVEA